jgi:hypothetical protein
MGDAIVLRVVIVLLGLVLASSAAHAQKRIALVIGERPFGATAVAPVTFRFRFSRSINVLCSVTATEASSWPPVQPSAGLKRTPWTSRNRTASMRWRSIDMVPSIVANYGDRVAHQRQAGRCIRAPAQDGQQHDHTERQRLDLAETPAAG